MPGVWSERALKNLYFKGRREGSEGRAIQCKEGMKKKEEVGGKEDNKWVSREGRRTATSRV